MRLRHPDVVQRIFFFMGFKPLKKQRNVFISEGGYVFKIIDGKEVELPVVWRSNNKKLFVKIDKKEMELVYLMIEYFIGDLKETDRIKFTISTTNRIPLTSIKIIPFASKHDLLAPEEHFKLKQYKCDRKADRANCRALDKITGFEVYTSLKTYGFRCIYCMDKVKPDDWHLDHYHPIASNGKNVFENLVPSCSRCNLMKGSLAPSEFIALCRKIVNNSLIKNIQEEMSEKAC